MNCSEMDQNDVRFEVFTAMKIQVVGFETGLPNLEFILMS